MDNASSHDFCLPGRNRIQQIIDGTVDDPIGGEGKLDEMVEFAVPVNTSSISDT
jgi:hypothetical protein